jgi:hypothetical protein
MEFQEKERLDRMEQHLRLIKEDLQNISGALIGCKLNGNKGILTDIDNIKNDIENFKEKLDLIELDIAKKSVYIGQLKFVAGLLTAGLFGTIIKMLSR